MGADDDVDAAIGELFADLAAFGGGAEAVEDIDAHRVIRHAFPEVVVMLLGEDRGGGEDGDLFSGHDRLEGCADGDLGFAEADVAADEAVHGAWGFHVLLGIGDGAQLVRGFAIEERAFEFVLPAVVRWVGEAGCGLAGGIDLEELFSVFED